MVYMNLPFCEAGLFSTNKPLFHIIFSIAQNSKKRYSKPSVNFVCSVHVLTLLRWWYILPATFVRTTLTPLRVGDLVLRRAAFWAVASSRSGDGDCRRVAENAEVKMG